MAFENLGTGLGWGTGPTITVDIAYEHRRSAADMQYRFRVSINPPSYNGYFGYKIALSITLDGVSKLSGVLLKEASPQRWSSAITYTSDWFTVAGKVTGSTSARISVYAVEGSSRNYSYNYSLTVEPGISLVSMPRGTLGVSQTIAVTRYVSTYTHTISYKCGSASGTIATKTDSTAVSWSPPVALAAQNTTGTSVAVSLTITTYSGNTVVGSYSTNVTEDIPASIKPTASLTLSDPEGFVAAMGGYVQGKSKLRYSIAAAGSQGSTIKSYKVLIGNSLYTAQSDTHAALDTPGTVTLTATITDSRGRSVQLTSSITVLAYSIPTIKACTAVRCQSDGTPDDSGEYALITFSADVSPVGDRNEATYTLRYRRAGASWSETAIAYTGYSPRNVPIIIAASSAAAYEVYVSITDAISTTDATIIPIPVAFEYLQINTNITSVAIGQKATIPDTFAVGLTSQFNGAVIGQVLGLGKAMDVIPAYADLNDYKTFGVYSIEQNAIAQTIRNGPWADKNLAPNAGTLRCYSGTGSGRINGTYAYIIQEFVNYLGEYTARRYLRTGDNDSWEAGSWRLFVGI